MKTLPQVYPNQSLEGNTTRNLPSKEAAYKQKVYHQPTPIFPTEISITSRDATFKSYTPSTPH